MATRLSNARPTRMRAGVRLNRTRSHCVPKVFIGRPSCISGALWLRVYGARRCPDNRVGEYLSYPPNGGDVCPLCFPHVPWLHLSHRQENNRGASLIGPHL